MLDVFILLPSFQTWDNFNNTSFVCDDSYFDCYTVNSQSSNFYESNLTASIRTLIDISPYWYELGEKFILELPITNFEVEW